MLARFWVAYPRQFRVLAERRSAATVVAVPLGAHAGYHRAVRPTTHPCFSRCSRGGGVIWPPASSYLWCSSGSTWGPPASPGAHAGGLGRPPAAIRHYAPSGPPISPGYSRWGGDSATSSYLLCSSGSTWGPPASCYPSGLGVGECDRLPSCFSPFAHPVPRWLPARFSRCPRRAAPLSLHIGISA